MHFSSFWTTINSSPIVNAINQHGIPVFETTEMHLKPFICQNSVCNLADIIAVYKQSERFYIVGIEIKEWDKRVNPKIAIEYLETYRHTCEYFYLAAKKFSLSTLEVKDIGLFDLTRMKVIKSSDYLYPDVDFRAHLMGRIKNNFKVLTNAVDDPFQRTIGEYSDFYNAWLLKKQEVNDLILS
jgi:hypothetical protein